MNKSNLCGGDGGGGGGAWLPPEIAEKLMYARLMLSTVAILLRKQQFFCAKIFGLKKKSKHGKSIV